MDHRLNATHITHHDLDGYGASTVAALFRAVTTVVHVPRYADVGPVLESEMKRLGKALESELLLVTDLGLEDETVKLIRSFAALNRRRDDDKRHRLVVLDHHVSSLDQLRAHDLAPSSEQGALSTFDLGDPAIAILIDPTRCATRMTYDHRTLYGGREGDAARSDTAATLVAAIDAVDLWQKAEPAFQGGAALDEVFWDNVSNFVPPGHPWHDRFVSEVLFSVTGLLDQGLSPAQIERETGTIRARILDAFLADDPDDDKTGTTRVRIARVLARSEDLFGPLSDGTLVSFGLDAGTFQRVSDRIMVAGRAKRVANVQRTGSISFRSVNETALDGARKFRGGGHKDAAGGKLPSGSAFSLPDAISQVEAVLHPPSSDLSASPFAALKNWKG